MAQINEVKVPDIGGFKGVTVIEVAVKKGDTLAAEQTLITLETDKATMDVPAPFAGVVKEMKIKAGDKVSEGDLIALVEGSAAVKAEPAPQTAAPAASAPVAAKPAPAPAPVAAMTAPAPAASGGSAHASPSIRRFARELGVNLTQVGGSGEKGRVTKDDVQNFVKRALAQPQGATGGGALPGLLPWPDVDFAKFGEIERRPLSRINKLSGANLARNWAMIPHVTQFDEADITEMETFRKRLGEEQKEVKVTPLVFLIKAVVAALQQYPAFNASLDGDELVLKKYFHIGIAVDTPDGLVVPVIRNADQKGLLALSKELAEISVKAREKKLGPADMSGGCFSISSLGGIGGTAFTPIINAPEVAILGVSKAQTKPLWNGTEFIPRLLLPLSLSYDHRVIDGAAAARFTAFLARALTDLRRLLL